MSLDGLSGYNSEFTNITPASSVDFIADRKVVKPVCLLFVCLLFVCLFVRSFVCCLFVCLFVCSFVRCLFVVCLFVCLFVVCLFVCCLFVIPLGSGTR